MRSQLANGKVEACPGGRSSSTLLSPHAQPTDFEAIKQKSHEITRHLQALRDQKDPSAVSLHQIHLLVTDLATTLEELKVTQEELELQNARLLEAHDALAAQRNRYASFFAFCPDPYFVTDSLGVIEEANDAACQMLGAARDALVAKPLAFLVASEDRSIYRTLTNQLVRGETAHDVRIRIKTYREREFRNCAVRHSPIKDERGKLKGIYWLFRDITAELKNEAMAGKFQSSTPRRRKKDPALDLD